METGEKKRAAVLTRDKENHLSAVTSVIIHKAHKSSSAVKKAGADAKKPAAKKEFDYEQFVADMDFEADWI